MKSPIQTSREVLGGTPVFVGTRVPVQTLLDYLEAGQSIGAFLSDFPSVTHQAVIDTLETMKQSLLGHHNASAA